jgi:hypothetical protein
MKAYHLRVVALAPILASGLLADANSQSCDSVLRVELQRTDVQTAARSRANRYFACSHDFQEFNNTYGGNAKAQYYAFGGEGAYNQSNYQRFQQFMACGRYRRSPPRMTVCQKKIVYHRKARVRRADAICQ